EAGYRAVHTQLVQGARAAAKLDLHGAGAAWQRLESLLSPWLSLQTLSATDAETLKSVHQRCLACARSLGLSSGSGSGWAWLLFAAVFLLVVGAGTLLLSGGVSLGSISWPSPASIWRLVQSSPVVVVVPLVVLASLFLLPPFFAL